MTYLLRFITADLMAYLKVKKHHTNYKPFIKGALLESGTLSSSIPLQTSLSIHSCWKKQHLIICLFMFWAFVVSSHRVWTVENSGKSSFFFFFETQVRWREVTFIQPLLVHRTMTLYNRQATGRSPHGFTICSQFSFPPSLYRSSPSSPLPPLFPSSCRLDSALESCERTWTSCFFLVLSLSAISFLFLHMLPRCHLLQTLSRHPVKSTFFFFILSPFWSLRSRFPRCRDKWFGIFHEMLRSGYINFRGSAVMPSCRLKTMRVIYIITAQSHTVNLQIINHLVNVLFCLWSLKMICTKTEAFVIL